MKLFPFTYYKTICILCMTFMPFASLSQKGFQLPEGVSKDRIAFQLINNLVVVPVEVNGVELSFLLDTGVNNTILFGVTQIDSISLKSAVPIKIKGLGNDDEIRAIKSVGNTIKINNAVDDAHTIFVVFNEMVDFSKRMGVPIHGIIGYNFYKSFIVKTNYNSKRITIYNDTKSSANICNRCEAFDLNFYRNKPYIKIDVINDTIKREAVVLVDSGSSDALWLFGEGDYIDTLPNNYFDDFLGMSVSGSIFGKRSRVDGVGVGKFLMNEVTVAFPKISKNDSLVMYKDRDGSLGGEVLKRFTVIMDYQNKRMHLKRNSKLNQPFNYNLSGITLEYDGTVQIKELQDIRSQGMNLNYRKTGNNDGSVNILIDPVFSLFTTPKIVIAEMRENSPASLAGLKKGDAIVKVNGTFAYKYKMYELAGLFSSKEGRKITIDYERNGYFGKVAFRLKRIL